MRRPLLLLLALALSPLAHAEACNTTQASMNFCAGDALKQADTQLNTLYKQQMSYLKTPQKQQALRNAQRQWIVFRDAECLYRTGKPEDSGSIWPLLDAQCKTELTQQRVEQLKVYVACRRDDCPK